MIRSLTALSFCTVFAFVATAQATDRTPALAQVGTLECVATRLKEGPIGTKLACKLDAANGADKANFEGNMYGEALYLLAPGEIRVTWKVMAPTQTIKPSHLEGDYDRVSKHVLQYPRDNRKVLMGGKDDLIGLELVVPSIDGLEASTLLSLNLSP